MFLITNRKDLSDELLFPISGLKRQTLGSFDLWYNPALGVVKEVDQAQVFVYGICHEWREGRLTPFSRLAAPESLFGDYFLMSFQPQENSYTFYSDHIGLGAVSYHLHEGLTLFNDPQFSRLFPSPFRLNHQGIHFFLKEGVFADGTTIFHELRMTDPRRVYKFQNGQLQTLSRSMKQISEFESRGDSIDQFYEILISSTALLLERFQVSSFLLSGGSDSRLVLGCLPKDCRSYLTAVGQLTRNPNSPHEVPIAQELARSQGLNFKQEELSLDSVDHGLVRFLKIQDVSEFRLTGFHGTELIGDGNFEFLKTKLTSFRDRQELSISAMGPSFLSSLYEESGATLFHFPRLLMSRGFLTPFRNSLLIQLLRQMPVELLVDYRLYEALFRRHLPELLKVPFHSKITQHTKFPSTTVDLLPVEGPQTFSLPKPQGTSWNEMATETMGPLQEARFAKVFYMSQSMINKPKDMDNFCAAFSKATCLTPFKETPCCRIDSLEPAAISMACQQCVEEERVGRRSLRQRIEMATQQATEGLVYADVSFSNLCNLRCRMCTSALSTSWADVDLAMGRVPQPLAEISSTDLERVAREAKNFKIAGGEPFLYRRHKDFLRKLSQRSDCHELNLVYITNGTVLPDPEVTDLWGQFAQVILTLSIDGSPAVNSYVRSRTSRYNVAENIQSLRSISTVTKLRSHSVLMAYNLHTLSELFEYLQDLQIEDNFFTLLSLPDYLAVDIIPLAERERVIKNGEASLPARFAREYRGLAEQILARPYRPDLLAEFQRFTEIFDRIDGLSLQAINPELWSSLYSH